MAIIMCMGMIVSCDKEKTSVIDTVKKDPGKAVSDGSAKYFEALSQKYGDVFAALDKAASGVGTYKLDIKGDDGDAESVLAAGVGVEAVVDAANCKYSGELSIGVGMGITAGISLWGDNNNIALHAPLLLGEEKYGVAFDTFMDKFPESELFNVIGGGMSFEDFKAALGEETDVPLDEIFDAFSMENLKRSMEKYVKDTEAVLKGITPEITEGKFDELDVVSVKYTLTKEDMKKLAEVEKNTIKEMFSKLISLGIVAPENIESVFENADDENVVFTWHLGKINGILSGMEIISDDGTMKVNFGADVAKKFEMNMDLSVDADGEKTDIKLGVSEVTDEGKGGFVVKFDYNDTAPATEGSAEGEKTSESAAVSMIRNDADGKYEMKIESDGETTAVVAGQLTYNADEFRLTVDSATIDGETSGVGFALSVLAGGEVEALPGYKNILDMGVDELNTIMYLLEMLSGWGAEDEYEDEYYEDEYYDEEYMEVMSMYEEFMADDELSDDEIDALYAVYYEDMTEDEIAEFEKDLVDLGMTKEEFISIMFVEG